MANPVILWRESYGYGNLTWSQVYVFVTGTGGVTNAGTPTLNQWGRGTGADTGWAILGDAGTSGAAGLRATTLGFSGAIDTNAVSNNKVGVAFAYNQAGQVGGHTICEFWDDDALGNGSFSAPLLHLSIGTLNDGRVYAAVGNPRVPIGISTFVMPIGLLGPNGNYTHIEITHPVIHSTNGSVQVYANQTLILNLSGVQTRNSSLGSGKIGYVQPRTGSISGGQGLMTDLIVHDCSGTGRILDKRVTYRRAKVAGSFTVGTGTYTAGTPTGAGTNLACVSEQAADGDTTYVLMDDTALPKKVSFPCEPMPANTITIDEVTEHVTVRKADASANTGRQLMKSGATEVNNGADVGTPSGYNLFTLVGPAVGHQTDPNTSAAWTVVNCDAVEVGYNRTA